MFLNKLAIALFLTFSISAHAGLGDLIKFKYKVAPPPTAGMQESVVDMQTVLKWQDVRTDEQCAVAGLEPEPMFIKGFLETGLLTENETREVMNEVKAIAIYSALASGYYKHKFKRARPYDVNPRVVPCIEKPSDSSYPSGHAAALAAVACVLANKFPDRADKLTAMGDLLSDLRVISGVHYPSDVRAGLSLGKQICKKYVEDKLAQ